MKIDRRLPVIAGCVLVYAVSIASPGVFSRLYRVEQPLEPYLTVITTLDAGDAARLLAVHGVDEVISPATTMVHVTRFSRVDLAPLDHALSSLDPLDPRRDPYIGALSGYFRSDTRAMVYARIPGSLLSADRLVRRALGGAGFVAEWSLSRSFAAAVVALLGAAAASVACRRGPREVRLLVPFLVLPWIPAALAGGFAVAAAGAVIVFLAAWTAAEYTPVAFARRRYRRSELRTLKMRFGWTIVMLPAAFAAVLAIAGGRAAAMSVIAAVGMVTAVLSAAWVVRGRRCDDEHRLFVPVLLTAWSISGAVGKEWLRVGPILAAVVMLFPPALDVLLPGSAGDRPVTISADDSALDAAGLYRLWLQDPPGALPDLADYVAHRAYQEGLLYNRPYGFPTPGEQVLLSRFREEPGGSYSSFREVVVSYDEEWFTTALDTPAPGIARMLVDLGRPVGVVLARRVALYSRYSRLWQHALLVFVTLVPFLLPGLPRLSESVARRMVADITGRRRQVA